MYFRYGTVPERYVVSMTVCKLTMYQTLGTAFLLYCAPVTGDLTRLSLCHTWKLHPTNKNLSMHIQQDAQHSTAQHNTALLSTTSLTTLPSVRLKSDLIPCACMLTVSYSNHGSCRWKRCVPNAEKYRSYIRLCVFLFISILLPCSHLSPLNDRSRAKHVTHSDADKP